MADWLLHMVTALFSVWSDDPPDDWTPRDPLAPSLW